MKINEGDILTYTPDGVTIERYPTPHTEILYKCYKVYFEKEHMDKFIPEKKAEEDPTAHLEDWQLKRGDNGKRFYHREGGTLCTEEFVGWRCTRDLGHNGPHLSINSPFQSYGTLNCDPWWDPNSGGNFSNMKAGPNDKICRLQLTSKDLCNRVAGHLGMHMSTNHAETGRLRCPPIVNTGIVQSLGHTEEEQYLPCEPRRLDPSHIVKLGVYECPCQGCQDWRDTVANPSLYSYIEQGLVYLYPKVSPEKPKRKPNNHSRAIVNPIF